MAPPPSSTSDALSVRVLNSASEVPAATWDALAGVDNPFVEHGFFHCLEVSGCLGAEAGWVPRYLAVERGDELVGLSPTFAKNHSYGEYIFDWGWANGARHAGLPYYPKLVTAVPFTPATGPRLLVSPGHDAERVRAALAGAGLALTKSMGCHSAHVLFCTEAEQQSLSRAGYLARTTHQYHWHNRGYRDFTDFLDAFTAKRRKEVRRERRAAHGQGLSFRVVPGPELQERHWAALYTFYEDTTSKRWGSAYFNREFFFALAEHFAHRVVAVLVERDGTPVAGTLNFRKGKHLYGRYWGCVEELDCVHFEACYYQLIDYAIEQGIELFEAGAQGEHKIRRGFLPSVTRSAHFIAHPGLRRAVEGFLQQEEAEVLATMRALTERGPYSMVQATT